MSEYKHSEPRILHCWEADYADFQRMADKLADLRQQLDYLNLAWKRVFDLCPACDADPSGSHPEQVEHVARDIRELRELRELAPLIGPTKFHGFYDPTDEQLAAERRFRKLIGLDVDSKKES